MNFVFLDLGAIAQSQTIRSSTTLIPNLRLPGMASTRDAVIVDCQGVQYRVKNIKYGNRHAAAEVLMSKFMALCLPTPHTVLALNTDDVFRHSKKNRWDFGTMSPDQLACVASRIERGFKDLGRFLLENGEHVVEGPRNCERYGAFLQQHEVATAEAQDIYHRSREVADIIHRQPNEAELSPSERILLKPLRAAQKRRIDALTGMFELLPPTLHYEISLAHYASVWLGNWDEYNYSLFNTGFVVNGSEISSMVVDYGNCGPIGFKGQDKHDSLGVTMQRARVDDPMPANDHLLPADIHFDMFSRVFPKDAVQKAMSMSSITALGATPRNRPFVQLYRNAIRAETEYRADAAVVGYSAPPGKLPREIDPALEIAFTLSRVSHATLALIADRHWPIGRHPAFPPAQSGQEPDLDANRIAAIMDARRNRFIAQFTQQQIKDWAERHPHRAHRAVSRINEVAQMYE